MAGIQTYNETFLGNAKVPETGTKAGAGRVSNYDTRISATGNPAGIQTFDPTGSPRVTHQVKNAAIQSATPGGSTKFRPAGVQTFTPDRV